LRRLLPLLLLFAACATAPPTQPALPEWDSIPAGIAAALCTRLQMDGIGSVGTDVSLVRITQPIATPQALASLGKPNRRVAIIHRAIPVAATTSKAGGCAWKMVDALDPQRQFDSMVIELSAPVANPSKDAAGIVVRASLGGTHPSWYWIDLIRHGESWAVGRIFPLPL
jgi:hypothetical protein